ncbi:hypothetical protein [Desulforhabdus sp. TSK]|nr:hypothetical protein [Desulforhabdus sp. TSK]GKT10241.1 hypothetical protein DSTSK_35460 [Desulforhabdus sp. TSK]
MHFHELPEVLKNLDDISVIHTMEKYNGGEIQERLTIILAVFSQRHIVP